MEKCWVRCGKVCKGRGGGVGKCVEVYERGVGGVKKC